MFFFFRYLNPNASNNIPILTNDNQKYKKGGKIYGCTIITVHNVLFSITTGI